MIRNKIKKNIINFVNAFQTKSTFLGSPKITSRVKDWCIENKSVNGVTYTQIEQETVVSEKPPITINTNYPSLFSDEFLRVQDNTFVATIPKGRVWGRYGAVISFDDTFLLDVSREFGKYGGVFGKKNSIFQQLKLSPLKKIKGCVAVISGAGSANYHHWLYDILPRIHLLKLVGIFNSIDYFIVDYTGLNFQKESLDLLGIPLNKIITCNDHWNFHIEAEELIVPSLSGRLGTISGWAIDFLRNIFLQEDGILYQQNLKIYLSRRKAPTRKLNNEDEIFKKLSSLGYVEFFAEDYSIQETAKVFAKCECIVGVHGSGFANLAFISPNTKILDILAPEHFDGYYWMITNNRKADYAYLFGKGKLLPNGTDLVQNKIDKNIDLNIDDLNIVLKRIKLKDAEN